MVHALRAEVVHALRAEVVHACLGHEAKVEEDESPIICEHHIALVRVRMHHPGDDEGGRACLHSHIGHPQSFRGGEPVEVPTVNPLGDDDTWTAGVLVHGVCGRGGLG